MVDNKVIKDYVLQRYKLNAVFIPYGGDHTKAEKSTNELSATYKFLCGKYAFKVARIEPENNIEMILSAFARLSLSIVIVGNWQRSEYGKKLRKKYGCMKNFHLLDPIYNLEELNVLRSNCFLYVHGHSAGGTNPSLVEAMSLGLPILAYDVNFNRETTMNSAKYFKSKESLISMIDSTSEEEFTIMGNDIQRIANENYKWIHVVNLYESLYGH